MGTAISLAGMVPAVAAQSAGEPAAGPTTGTLQEVVVTARRRAESLQTVPVAVTVVPQATFNKSGAFQVLDMQTVAPGLTATQQVGTGTRNDVYFTIRGQSSTYGVQFPAVITYFAEVPTTQFGTGQFFDLDSVQVLRGPQGVQFGRVTDGGNIMVGPHRPTNDFDASVSFRTGTYSLVGGSGYVNLPIVDDKLLLRVAFDAAHRDGYTKNVYNGELLDSLDYRSFRVGLTFRPTDQLENYLVAQFQRVDDSGTSTELTGIDPQRMAPVLAGLFPLVTSGLSGAPVYGINSVGDVVPFQPGMTPLSVANYIADLQNNVARQKALGPRQLFQTAPSFDKRSNLYVVNTTDYHLTDTIRLKNILGYVRVRNDQATMAMGGTGAYIETCHSACPVDGASVPFNFREQFSEEFRASGQSLDNQLNWDIGTYWDYQHPAGPYENYTINLGILERQNIQLAYTQSAAAYTNMEFDASKWLPGLKFNAGYRYTQDRSAADVFAGNRLIPAPNLGPELTALAPFLGIPAAFVPFVVNATINQPLPHGVCAQSYGTGGLFAAQCNRIEGKFHANTYTGGVSYTINPRAMVYAKVSRGYRPGGVNQTSPSPELLSFGPEFDRSIEVGAKADWAIADMPVRTNIAAYRDKYTKIQQSLSVLDPRSSQIDSVIENVAAAIIQGVEFEGTLIPVRGLTLGLNYAFTDANFEKGPQDPSACDPNAALTIGFCLDNPFLGVPKHQVSLNANYEYRLPNDAGSVSLGGDFYYQSRQAQFFNAALSPGAISPPYSTLNLNASWKQVFGKPLDLAFFMTNVTDKTYTVIRFSCMQRSCVAADSVTYGAPRMFGFSATYRWGASAKE